MSARKHCHPKLTYRNIEEEVMETERSILVNYAIMPHLTKETPCFILLLFMKVKDFLVMNVKEILHILIV